MKHIIVINKATGLKSAILPQSFDHKHFERIPVGTKVEPVKVEPVEVVAPEVAETLEGVTEAYVAKYDKPVCFRYKNDIEWIKSKL